MLEDVKSIIAVASGKGGVGKSTVTANLALALAAKGFKVGLLDADVYGPSQALMLGVADGVRPQMKGENTFGPIEAQGLYTMSMAYLVTEKTPMVWRGPMVSGAFQQMLTQTDWPALDYLLIDMPPGTGDVQLTLAQKVQVNGAVIVTTPQDIALLDAKKGVEMFRKVKIPVLGVVENMSLHTCSECGHTEPVFGEGGGERIAKEYDTVLLGQLPLASSIREQADNGRPSVIAEPDGQIAGFFSNIADNVIEQLSLAGQDAPTITFGD
ncbi:iron-sulfur cluster carrier protein ApbC [Oceanospirillum maris]|uniref:iron-sulfur cluster carrier protein ApbC n=1 Tax=Oceanospirillum maris TaxID=64977 RepID=UPI000409E04E|nr:iron-sulfur cluster carrier protein ApbC [Oceanospirillum maris]